MKQLLVLITFITSLLYSVVSYATPAQDIDLYLFCDSEETVTNVLEAPDMKQAFVGYVFMGKCIALSEPITAKLGRALKVYMIKAGDKDIVRMAVYEVIVDGSTFYSFGPVP